MTSSKFVVERANLIIAELQRSAAESASATVHQTAEVMCDEAGRKVTFPPQKNLTAITGPEVFQKIHFSFAEILSNLVNVQKRGVAKVDVEEGNAGSVRNLALVLGQEDLLMLISGLLSGVPVEVVAPRKADLVCFTDALNECLPKGFSGPNVFDVTRFAGAYRTLYLSQCSGTGNPPPPPPLTVRFPSEGGTNVTVESPGAPVHISALGRRVAHYVLHDACCEEFVAAGIRSAVSEYLSLGAALAKAAHGDAAKVAAAAVAGPATRHFCKAAGLCERDEKTLNFFAQLSRVTGNI